MTFVSFALTNLAWLGEVLHSRRMESLGGWIKTKSAEQFQLWPMEKSQNLG
jgi:hypothetical protein